LTKCAADVAIENAARDAHPRAAHSFSLWLPALP